MGGSTGTGITSGLDKPRQQYNKAGIVDFFPTQSEFDQAKEMFPRYERPQGESFNRFLMSTGLDLMSRPPTGKGFTGLLSTADKLRKHLQKNFLMQEKQIEQLHLQPSRS